MEFLSDGNSYVSFVAVGFIVLLVEWQLPFKIHRVSQIQMLA